MVGESRIYNESYVAAADLSTSQFLIVKDGTVVSEVALAGAADGSGGGCGILQNDPKAGQAAQVSHLGISLLRVKGVAVAIAQGDPIKSDANGFGVKAATDKNRVIAEALEPATTDDVQISVRQTGVYNLAV